MDLLRLDWPGEDVAEEILRSHHGVLIGLYAGDEGWFEDIRCLKKLEPRVGRSKSRYWGGLRSILLLAFWRLRAELRVLTPFK